MSLQGKIISISNDGLRAKVLVKPILNCNGCKACAGILKNNKALNSNHEIEALINNNLVKPGNIVLLELTENQGSKIAVLIYGIPILGFLTGMLATPLFCNFINVQVTDLYRIIGAFSGLIISFIFIFIYIKKQPSDNFIMYISKIIN